MIAFNVTDTHRGFHLSAAQLISQDVYNPNLLQGTTMDVTFFEPGEVLFNGDVVTDAGVIVKSFIPEVDMELERQLAFDARKAQTASWLDAAKAARRPRTVPKTDNSQPSDTTVVPPVANPAVVTDPNAVVPNAGATVDPGLAPTPVVDQTTAVTGP